MSAQETTTATLPIDGLTVTQQPYDVMAVQASGILEYLSDAERLAMNDPRMSHFRQTVVSQCVELSTDLDSTILTPSSFEAQYVLQGVPEAFKRAEYIPEVQIDLGDLQTLRPFMGREGKLTVPAIDVFVPGHETAIRLCDLREQAGISVDQPTLREKRIRTKLENRFATDIAELFIRPNGAVVKVNPSVRYSKSGKDKLRTYYMPVRADGSVTTEYNVSQTIVRLADCASEPGEASIYRQLLGHEL